MKKFYTIILTVASLYSYQITSAQCTGVKGPNLLGAKGTFSTPAITINNSADKCTKSGSATYNPIGNVGMALTGCTATIGNVIPCSDYTYTAASGGLQPEFTYSIVKTIGDASGGNCLKSDWKGSDHTGDGGYFMAVNGAPSIGFSPVFYQIKNIRVCAGTTYEFSAWVLNILPSSSTSAIAGSEPNITFSVNGIKIANSGPIAYTSTPTWVKVGGTFVATTDSVNLQVLNATAVATGNDLGLDDISINVCQSQIAVNGPSSVTEGNAVTVNYVVTDPTKTNTWYKWQKSTNGGASFNDLGSAAQATYTGSTFTLPLALGTVNSTMNGYKYRLIVSTSQASLTNVVCTYFNDFTLIVTAGGPLPVQLTSFTGSYSNSIAALNWQTSQELNSDYFELFRSYDGVNFTSVTKVKSAGYSNTIKNYSFLDHVSGSNHVYYRLKQVDINGKESFSSIVNLSVGARTGVDVFPNPFNNNFTVSLASAKTTSATLKIQNTSGQLIYTKNISLSKGNNSIVINNLPSSWGSGIYYVTIVNEEINYNTKLQKL